MGTLTNRPSAVHHLHLNLKLRLLFLLPLLVFMGTVCTNIISAKTLNVQNHFVQKKENVPQQKRHVVMNSFSAPQNCQALINGFRKDERNETEMLCCDRSHFRTDRCYIKGDISTFGTSATVHVVGRHVAEERIKPYTRKWEKGVMKRIKDIRLKKDSSRGSRDCEIVHDVPGILFSNGGYTGNLFHEFNDGLIPLFLTSYRFQGKVVFLVTEYHQWWVTKYAALLALLSQHTLVNFDVDPHVHCFPELHVGLAIHGDLYVDPSLSPEALTIRNFTDLLAAALYRPTAPPQPPNLKPSLLVLSRKGKARVLTNQRALIRTAARLGFQVRVAAPTAATPMTEMFEHMTWCDVMVGVHGAAMTHVLMMRPGTMFVQVVPLGTEWAAAEYYGNPAVRMGLEYVEYRISVDESSLVRKYPRNHPYISRRSEVNAMGWWMTKQVYLENQNVTLSMSRFKPYLRRAYKHALHMRRLVHGMKT